tara:strand:+ start:5956 stop:6798 length:843 start_codon:yes stop_codon:yes gene_type:complete
MGLLKQKVVDVEIDGKNIKITVKRPSGSVSSKAGRIAAKVWTECIEDGIMTKKELKSFMEKRGIWTKAKDKEEEDLQQKIADLEKELAFGSGKTARIRASEGKGVAIEIREKRLKLRDLITERLSLEGNTAESLSDNARFDYLVACCTYDESGEKVYKTIEEYDERADDDIAFAAASAMAEMMYSLDGDFEKSLPENKFLNKHHFTNDDGALVNDKGETVDLEGRLINDIGHFLNKDGERVDIDGYLLDENGRYITTVDYIDEPIKKTRSTKTKESTVDG